MCFTSSDERCQLKHQTGQKVATGSLYENYLVYAKTLKASRRIILVLPVSVLFLHAKYSYR